MLFNSYAFLLVFLPLTAAAFHLLRLAGWRRAAFGALTLASLAFYGWWSLQGLGLLVGLILANYGLARAVMALRRRNLRLSRAALIVGLAFNLGVLGYFKYADFFIHTVDQLAGTGWPLLNIVLPLGISFFTFQKIALLVDCHAGKVERLDFLDYALFVAFFPQLIAGPITHHSEVMPQFRAGAPVTAPVIAQALAIFTIGLAKKVLLADTVARFASPVFDAAAHGQAIGLADGWIGSLAYTLQLYFDFSGYSDMAIGGALLFGVRLPLNFASPYKAGSIIEFWRRWHMTLSRFLRDYLYIPLGGNRRGEPRRYLNLMITMLLGGLWHGAGWTFVIWGALHGLYLTINHLWRAARPHAVDAGPVRRLAGAVLTFLAVVGGWVLFRARDLSAAGRVLAGMTGLNGVGATAGLAWSAPLIVSLLALVWLAPNTQQLAGYAGARPLRDWPVLLARGWAPSRAVAAGLVFGLAFLSLSKVSEFLYFQF